MKRTHFLPSRPYKKTTVARLLCLIIVIACAVTSQADPLAIGTKGVADTSSPPAAFKIFKDPATGQLTTSPSVAHPAQEEALRHALSTSAKGLVASPSLGGGIRVHLQGRFRHTTTVSRDANGQLAVQCHRNAETHP